uniref:(northern house mosquito) hypothetical protein n=2 Tax=Culex pipiens TaxID=7175 RepID=A0A8D8AZE9_CULPI
MPSGIRTNLAGSRFLPFTVYRTRPGLPVPAGPTQAGGRPAPVVRHPARAGPGHLRHGVPVPGQDQRARVGRQNRTLQEEKGTHRRAAGDRHYELPAPPAADPAVRCVRLREQSLCDTRASPRW